MTEILNTINYNRIESGFVRTTAMLDADPSLNSKLNNFSFTTRQSDNISILLPGLALPSETMFREQDQVFQSLGISTVKVDYSTSRFSSKLLIAQLLDCINSNADKSVQLIGVSFGAKMIIDLLQSAQPDEIKNVQKLVLMGGLTSIDDLSSQSAKRTLQVVSQYVPSNIVTRLAGLAQNHFNSDPEYASVLNTPASKDSIIDRMKSLSEVSTLDRIISTPTQLIWWEKERIGPSGQKKVCRLFSNSRSTTVPHEHGWTATSAPYINPVLLNFLAPESQL